MVSSKTQKKKIGIKEEAPEILEAHVSIDDLAEYVGKPYVVKDSKDLKQLYLYIDYLKRVNDFLTILTHNKERRIRNLRKGLERYVEIGHDYIPVKITEKDIEVIYNLAIPNTKNLRKTKILELIHCFISTQNYLQFQKNYNYKLTDIEFKFLSCGYLLETFSLQMISKAVFFSESGYPLRVKKIANKLESYGFLKTITIGKTHQASIYAITANGREYLEEFITAIYKGKYETYKLYENYTRRNKKGAESDVWKDFGFPIRPIGKAEAPIDRRRRVRNREQIQPES